MYYHCNRLTAVAGYHAATALQIAAESHCLSINMLPIITERLILRRFTAADAPALSHYRSQPEVAHFQAWETPFSLAQAEQMIAELPDVNIPPAGEWQQIALERRSDGIVIGDFAIGPQAANPQLVEIGYALAREHQGHGYAREALRALLGGLFAHGIHRVHALIDQRNQRSARLVSSVGFRHEGHMIEHMIYKGEWVTDDLYAILAREWPR
jgi:RimJ/RimL family protein N-acetyltransferase